MYYDYITQSVYFNCLQSILLTGEWALNKIPCLRKEAAPDPEEVRLGENVNSNILEGKNDDDIAFFQS